jgi:predicted Zn-dependent protease
VGRRVPPWAVTFACVALAAGLVACAADPGARRTRRAMSEEEEIEQGRQAAAEVEHSMGFAGSAELNAYVARIGQRLATHSSRSHLEYEFHVVDMKEPNAFALPGGYIYVSRGLLALMNDEDELATVLGHEIGHVAARHSVQRQAKSRPWIPLQILAGIGGAAASVVSPALGSAVAGAGQLPAALAMASYSRKQEEQADRLGQQYAAAAGWDPAALASSMDALTREQQLEGGGDPYRRSFFDSHPTTPDRARDARQYATTLTIAPEARIATDRTSFVGRLDGIVVGESVKLGVFLERRFIHPELGFAMSFPASWQHANAPTAVVARPEDESALVALQVAGEGDDPVAAAAQFDSEIPLLERSDLKEINRLPAVTGVARVVDQGEEIYLFLAWIAKDGLVYQVLGAALASHWSQHRPRFEETAESFHDLSESELREVHENRLRLVEAQVGETLSKIASRSDSQWPPAKMAVANDMTAETKLSGGESIKISKRERYQGAVQPASSATGSDAP